MKEFIPYIYPRSLSVVLGENGSSGNQSSWEKLSNAGANVAQITEADHHQILQDPYIGIWANTLKASLEKAQQEC